MKCQLCEADVVGDVIVTDSVQYGVPVIRMESTPDRDWITCDICNLLVCHKCCKHPESGYCDVCYKEVAVFTCTQCKKVTPVEQGSEGDNDHLCLECLNEEGNPNERI